MTSLNDASEVFIGNTAVHEIYLGNVFVWASAPVPGPPTNLIGTYASPQENTLGWRQPVEVNAAATYDVHYSVAGPITESGGGTFLASLPFAALSAYTHVKTVGERDLPHYYSVFCRLANGRAGEHATTTVEKGLPAPPATLVGNGDSTTSNSLTWTPPSPIGSAEGYRLLFKTGAYPAGPEDATATVLLDNVPLTTVSYSHTGLVTDTTYYYSIFCTSDLGYSSARKDTATTLRPPPPIPGPPTTVSGITGYVGCCWWLSWKNPTNCAVDADYNMDNFQVRCQANGTQPGNSGGVVKATYTSIKEGTSALYSRFPAMDNSNPASGTHAVSVYANNSSGVGAAAGDTCNTGNQNPCGSMVLADGMSLEDADPQREVIYQEWCGMPFPDDESQAWEGVERQLANTDHTDEEGWWARLLLSIDVLAYRGEVPLEVVAMGDEIPLPESKTSAYAVLPVLLERITSLVADRRLNEVTLAELEAIKTWHFIDGAGA